LKSYGYSVLMHRRRKNPPTLPGDKTKNKNYEQTLTLILMYGFPVMVDYTFIPF